MVFGECGEQMNVLNRLNDYALRVSMGLQNVNKEQFQKAFDVLADAYLNGKKEVFVCGNGGSLTMSDHFHCDHGKGTHFDAKMKPRIQPLTNGSILTAIANDIGYDEVFSFQLGFKAKKGDILVAISASGNSPNIIKAIEKAKELEMTVIAFVGFNGGKAKELADIFWWVRDNNYGTIEDCHQGFMHVLAQAIRTKYNCNPEIKL